MAAQWQWRNRGSLRRWECIAKPDKWWAQMEYRQVQVVDAAVRGDACYAGRTGFFWHVLGKQAEILTDTVSGPYPTRREAEEASTGQPTGQTRQLKSVGQLRVVSVQVVNETPGSVRDVPVEAIGTELRRMGGERFAAALDRAQLAHKPA